MNAHAKDTLNGERKPPEPSRIAILSDVHGNLPAFKAVLEDIGQSGVDALWCLGDLVGYGAQPDECVSLAAETCDLCLIGNHDLVAIDRLDIDDFSANAAIAATWTKEHIAPPTVDYLERLAPADESHTIGLYHASPRDPVWEYVLSPLQAELCLDVQQQRVALIGHSHVALSFSRFSGAAATGEVRAADEELELSDGEWLINPGSVGQPRDGDPRAAWLELDLDDLRAVYRRTEYDIAGAGAAIRAARLPDSLAERLLYGQ
jgi:predicted phosphodiesterase